MKAVTAGFFDQEINRGGASHEKNEAPRKVPTRHASTYPFLIAPADARRAHASHNETHALLDGRPLAALRLLICGLELSPAAG